MKYLVFFVAVFFCACDTNDSKFNLLNGEFILNKFYYKNNCLSCDGQYFMYIDKKNRWVIIENQYKKEYFKGKFKLYFNKKREILFDISNSNDEKIDGNYLIQIDTLLTSKQRDEFRIIIQSNNIYLETFKNDIKKVGIN